MPTIVIQKGHCFRKTGATGTVREQEFADACGNGIATRLRALGHVVHVVLADTPAPYPVSDWFVSLHTDGSTDQARRGASVGYPDAAGAQAATAWKRAHSRLGFPGGFLRDNYTSALRYYYGYGRSRSRHRFLAEHGTTTNPADRTWLFDNLDLCVQAHVDAIGEVLGHPSSKPTPPQEDILRVTNHVGFCLMPNRDLIITTKDGAIYAFNVNGGQGQDLGAYNRHNGLWGGTTPNAIRDCIGVTAVGNSYVQVFDDGKQYQWGNP